jgi:hypothetical protein
MKYIVEMGSGGMIYIPSLMKIVTGIWGLLKFCLRNVRRCNSGVADGKELVTCDIEMPSCGTIFLPNFMKIGTGVQEILRCCLRNLRGCNIGITDGK